MKESVDLVELLQREVRDLRTWSRDEANQRFLDEVVFQGLGDLRPSVDEPAIKHFLAKDFRVVVQRCTVAGVFVVGLEVFTPQGELVDIEIATQPGNDWCLALLARYESQSAFYFSATYELPDERYNAAVSLVVLSPRTPKSKGSKTARPNAARR